MFSLISKNRPAPVTRRAQCALCPNGDGMHPAAKLSWAIRDKEGKPLASKKKASSSSLLLLPDAEPVEPVGWPDEPVHLTRAPLDFREAVRVELSAAALPAAQARFPAPPAAARLAKAPRRQPAAAGWNGCNYINTPRVSEGPKSWQRCALPKREGVARDLRFAATGVKYWLLATRDIEVSVGLSPQPGSGSLPRAVLPVLKAGLRFRLRRIGPVPAGLSSPVAPVAGHIAAGGSEPPAPRLHRPDAPPLAAPATALRSAPDARLDPAGPTMDRTLRGSPIVPPEPVCPPERSPAWKWPSIAGRRFRGWRGNPAPLRFGVAPGPEPRARATRTLSAAGRRGPRYPAAWRTPVWFRAPLADLRPAPVWRTALQAAAEVRQGSWRTFAPRVDVPPIPD